MMTSKSSRAPPATHSESAPPRSLLSADRLLLNPSASLPTMALYFCRLGSFCRLARVFFTFLSGLRGGQAKGKRKQKQTMDQIPPWKWWDVEFTLTALVDLPDDDDGYRTMRNAIPTDTSHSRCAEGCSEFLQGRSGSFGAYDEGYRRT